MRSPHISIASGPARMSGPHRTPCRSTSGGAVLLLAALLSLAPAPAAAQAEPEPLRLRTVEPRAYGYHVGDTATRELVIDLPRRLQLDEQSLPALGRHGPALELRSLRQESEPIATGTRLSLRLEYQVFAAPVAVRGYELPAFELRFTGTPRAESLRVEAWPMVVAPLVPEATSPRRGLGELQPDTAPVLRDMRPEKLLLAACTALALLLGGYLAMVYFGLPWLGERQRPFTRAYRQLRAGRAVPASAQSWQEACRSLHAAFNETAGRVVFADTVDGFLSRSPRFAPLADDIRAFFARSQAGFFEGGADANTAARERDWLLALARACRNAERGTA